MKWKLTNDLHKYRLFGLYHNMVRRDSHIQVYYYATLSYESSESLPDISIGGCYILSDYVKIAVKLILRRKNNGKD